MICDPKCLLQWPDTSKLPKVLRRGCKRCFGAMWAKSLLHWCKRGLPWCKTGLHWCKRLLGGLFLQVPKTPFAPSPYHFGQFEVSGLCSRHSGSQILMSRVKNCPETIFVSQLPRTYPHRRGNSERGKNALSCGGETVWEAF